jgi:hypothetical protein
MLCCNKKGGYDVTCHLQRYFSYIVAVNFIGGGNRSTLNVNVSDGMQMNTTETKELCQVFEKLLPYKNYSFNVTAKTKVGEGVSQSITVETDTDGEFL